MFNIARGSQLIVSVPIQNTSTKPWRYLVDVRLGTGGAGAPGPSALRALVGLDTWATLGNCIAQSDLGVVQANARPTATVTLPAIPADADARAYTCKAEVFAYDPISGALIGSLGNWYDVGAIVVTLAAQPQVTVYTFSYSVA